MQCECSFHAVCPVNVYLNQVFFTPLWEGSKRIQNPCTIFVLMATICYTSSSNSRIKAKEFE